MATTSKDVCNNTGVRKLVTTIAEKEGFMNFELKFTAMSPDIGNFMGALCLVKVEEEGKETMNLFVKAVNTPEALREKIKVNKMFQREVYMYTTIADVFHKLQEKHNIPASKRFKFPKYYGSCLADFDEAIVLENLMVQGFEHPNGAQPVSLEYAKISMEEIAKFHALSFALEKEDPQLFNEVIKNSKELDIKECTEMIEGMRGGLTERYRLIEPENRRKVEKYFEINENKTFTKQYVPISKYSVLAHGDYRKGNTMVKYQNSSIAELIHVDYQTAFYGCPLNDVILFIFMGTDAEFRRLHFDDITEHYYNSLDSFLKLMSHDINNIYPKATFKAELKEKLMYGLEVALFQLNLLLTDPKDCGGLELDNIVGNLPPNKVYEERLNGIVRDLVRWGLLN